MNGTPRRDFVYVDDVVAGLLSALDTPVTGIYNLGTGHGYTIREVVETIAMQLGVPAVFGDEPTTGPLDFFADVSRIQSDLGWRAKVSLEDGIARTIADIVATM